MINKPMYPFIIEEVSRNKPGHILFQTMLYAHDEADALIRFMRMNPNATTKEIERTAYSLLQPIEVVSPSHIISAKTAVENVTGGGNDAT